MAQSVEIKNFRGFKSADLPDCRRVNILVGENGSGKTALLEAVVLASALTPAQILRFRSLRGFDTNQVLGARRSIDRAVWGDLFHNFDFAQSVLISLHGNRQHTRSVSIQYNERNISIPKSAKSKESRWSPVTFIWRDHSERILHVSNPYISEGKIQVDPSPESLLDSAYYAANTTYSQAETVNRFSELSRNFNQDEVIGFFKDHFKNIEDLSIEMNAGFPAIYAKVPGLPEKLPLTLMSGGMNKLASILFAMPSYKDGIILIDEIENGFHYKRFPEIWSSILHFANTYEVQIFAATHSWECLSAAAEVAATAPESFSLIHTGKHGVKQSPGASFVGAIEEQVEIR